MVGLGGHQELTQYCTGKLYVCVSVCLSVCLSVCQSAPPSDCHPDDSMVSLHGSTLIISTILYRLAICLCVDCLSVCRSVYLSAHLSIGPALRLTVIQEAVWWVCTGGH